MNKKVLEQGKQKMVEKIFIIKCCFDNQTDFSTAVCLCCVCCVLVCWSDHNIRYVTESISGQVELAEVSRAPPKLPSKKPFERDGLTTSRQHPPRTTRKNKTKKTSEEEWKSKRRNRIDVFFGDVFWLFEKGKEIFEGNSKGTKRWDTPTCTPSLTVRSACVNIWFSA